MRLWPPPEVVWMTVWCFHTWISFPPGGCSTKQDEQNIFWNLVYYQPSWFLYDWIIFLNLQVLSCRFRSQSAGYNSLFHVSGTRSNLLCGNPPGFDALCDHSLTTHDARYKGLIVQYICPPFPFILMFFYSSVVSFHSRVLLSSLKPLCKLFIFTMLFKTKSNNFVNSLKAETDFWLSCTEAAIKTYD